MMNHNGLEIENVLNEKNDKKERSENDEMLQEEIDYEASTKTQPPSM